MVKSCARLSVFARGRVVGMADAGAERRDIREKGRKTNGERANIRAIDAILAHAREDSVYDG